MKHSLLTQALDDIETLFEGATHGLRAMNQQEATVVRDRLYRFVARAYAERGVTPEERKRLEEIMRQTNMLMEAK